MQWTRRPAPSVDEEAALEELEGGGQIGESYYHIYERVLE
jgi:hypothetical protein